MEERCILVHPNDEAYGDASKKECTSPPLATPAAGAFQPARARTGVVADPACLSCEQLVWTRLLGFRAEKTSYADCMLRPVSPVRLPPLRYLRQPRTRASCHMRSSLTAALRSDLADASVYDRPPHDQHPAAA
jgi:hypothetical protein